MKLFKKKGKINTGTTTHIFPSSEPKDHFVSAIERINKSFQHYHSKEAYASIIDFIIEREKMIVKSKNVITAKWNKEDF